MNNFQTHYTKVKKRFKYTLDNYQLLKDTISKNPGLSQAKIAKLLNKTQSYVNKTIRTYNKRENLQRMTYNINYFYRNEKIEEAKYIQIIEKMINDTLTNKYLPLENSLDICDKYDISYNTLSIYINYILSGLSKDNYKIMIEETIS